jgi:signal transduction histidine kinase
VNVWTEFQAASGLARIIVEDNGDGIEPEDLEAIFSLFVSRKGSRGTGLGLPVSEKIMKEHGGRIVVESQLGKGSRFMLELPAVYAELSRQTSTLPEMPAD